ncbi:hypothetical protein [Phyllobacterium endophyticum]|uniref:Uncharacterized protein n=1 Tax=Phyllobacterium endophyticum TaxID=1149773 RepID=A0A2P7AQQ2_9HYPH|nr:hypothetical protein [Phyllobacterium endophyticum]MBB3236988.1 hypothetical protein [Phyllobacterium endophyticum]PSH56561.1 hypothetical protein CU100_14345 [Phyllobacterium endophyticum]TYR44438.1 hypothetical protein FY050_04795 [Phyllobacterium endophyticum]
MLLKKDLEPVGIVVGDGLSNARSHAPLAMTSAWESVEHAAGAKVSNTSIAEDGCENRINQAERRAGEEWPLG